METKPKTNADRIRNMTDEELAKLYKGRSLVLCGGTEMSDYINRGAAIAYIREQSEEMSKAFEDLGGESGIYADAYNDLAEDFHRIPAADVEPVRRGRWEGYIHSRYCGIDEYGEPIYRDVIVYYCSNPKCRRKTVIKENYCPSCGSKMDLEV